MKLLVTHASNRFPLYCAYASSRKHDATKSA